MIAKVILMKWRPQFLTSQLTFAQRLMKIWLQVLTTRLQKKKNAGGQNEGYCGEIQNPREMQHACVPRVNEALWSDLEKPAKSRDLAMQDVQKCMLDSARPLFEAIQMTKVSRKNKTPIDSKLLLECLRNALTCVGNASHQASMRRREFLKPELSKNFRSLCSSSLPLTKYLFGNDLPKKVDEIAKANKITSKVVTKETNSGNRSDRRKPVSRNDNRFPGVSFLQGRSGSYRRGRYCQGNSRSSTTTRSHQELKVKS